MGADYYARTVIGVPLPGEDELPRLKVSVRKKAFDHDYFDDGETDFHPKDGRKLWLDEKEDVETAEPLYVFDIEEDKDTSEMEKGQKLVKIPRGLSTAYETDCNRYFVGFVSGTDSSNGGGETVCCKVPDIEVLKDRLKKFLEPLEMWDAKGFGIYTILYCSY